MSEFTDALSTAIHRLQEADKNWDILVGFGIDPSEFATLMNPVVRDLLRQRNIEYEGRLMHYGADLFLLGMALGHEMARGQMLDDIERLRGG